MLGNLIARWRARRTKRTLLWGALLFTYVFISLLFRIPQIGVQEWRLYDFWMTGEHPGAESEYVAVAGVDDELFEVLGFEWPLSKDTYAQFTYLLQEMGAKTVVFDILFLNWTSDDALFRSFLSASKEDPDFNMVLGYSFIVHEGAGAYGTIPRSERESLERFNVDEGVITHPTGTVRRAQLPYKDLISDANHLGYVNRAVPLPDGVDRLATPLLSASRNIYSSLSLAAVAAHTGDKITYKEENNSLSVGSREIDLGEDNSFLINFKDSIPIYSLSSLYRELAGFLDGTVDSLPLLFKDKIVFIGNSAPSIGDFGMNPLSSRYRVAHSPNVYLHAYSAHTILTESAIGRYTLPFRLFISFLLLLLLFVIFAFMPNGALFITVPLVLVGTYLYGYMNFTNNLYFPVLEPLFGQLLFSVMGVVVNYMEGTKEYRFMSELFKTYISPKYLDSMLKSHTVPKLGGEEVEGTAFFTDIVHFSSFSEKLTPEELISLLNVYFRKMTNILLENHGTLDRYSGDAIIAFYGAPQHTEKHAYHACKTAVEMQSALADLRDHWNRDPNLKNLVGSMRMRIGINTGVFVTGNIGCEIRMNYTMIGDSVNLAARLESGAKQYGVYTLVGEKTYQSCPDQFLFREIDRVVVVGKAEPVRLYELIGGLELSKNDMINELCQRYSKGLEEYYSGNFEKAKSYFLDSREREIFTEHNPSALMISRCEEMINNPPNDWNGIYKMISK